MFSNGKWELGSGKQLIRVSRGATRTGPTYTLIEREVSFFPLPTSRPLTWWQFGLLSVAPLAVGVLAYALALLA